MTSGPQYPSYPGDEPGEVPRPADGSPPPPPPPPAYDPSTAQHPGPGAQGAPRQLAGWWLRVAASIVDSLAVFLVGVIPLVVGLAVLFSGAEIDATTEEVSGVNAAGIPIILLGVALFLGFEIWNRIVRQGRTGRSLGKSAVGLRLVDDARGVPVGVAPAAGRWGVSLLVGFVPCGSLVDVLWPLWDEKNQTLHDKVIAAVVIRD